MTPLPLDSIRTDGGTQIRAALDGDQVATYAEAMLEGATFPPVVVFFDGEAHWLADGFHRLEAARAAGLGELAADVREGTRRDAWEYAAGANAEHGLPRTREDKRRAVSALLEDEEWSRRSDRAIARHTKVSHTFVAKLRASMGGNVATPPRVNPEFAALLPPAGEEADAALEASIRQLGCLVPLVVWNGVLLDGHRRLAICERLGVPFRTREAPGVASRADALTFIAQAQLGRKNLSPDQVATMLAAAAA